MVQGEYTEQMTQLKKYFHRKNLPIVREYMPSKYLKVRNRVKSILEDRYKRKYGKRRKITNQAVNEAISDRITELLQNGRF